MSADNEGGASAPPSSFLQTASEEKLIEALIDNCAERTSGIEQYLGDIADRIKELRQRG